MSELYDAYYYATGCGQPYERNEGWLNFFGGVADRIIADIGPTTVLDAGCALGFLVEMLRERGAQAYGVDVSEFAIANVYPPIKPFCWVGTLVDPFPQRYDLIVTIEVLEHIPAADSGRVIANLCAHTDDILFSSTPLDYMEATHLNVQPPEYWAERFARHGFYRDVEFDAAFITPWTARFRRSREPASRIVAAYERRWWQLQQENRARREFNIEQRNELAIKEMHLLRLREQLEEREARYAEFERASQARYAAQARTAQARYAAQERTAQALSAQLRGWEKRWAQLQSSPGWALLRSLQNLRARIAPPGSTRDQAMDDIWRGVRARQGEAFVSAVRLIRQDVSRRTRGLRSKNDSQPSGAAVSGKFLQVDPVLPRAALQVHQATAEVIVCVHNALADVQRCLESVVRHTTSPYALILVDDGSDAPARDYLAEFARIHSATLSRNEQARGYTFAANQGLRHAAADYVVLLNSDTIVAPEWLDRMIACAESNPHIGLVGPLSNTASWQSIPEIESQGDWAANPLPVGITVEAMGQIVARSSARLYPKVPLLNGFCLLLRRELIQEIGYFDEDSFGAGYGEEDDYALRAGKAGWSLAWADDVHVYHAQSRSYSDEKRKALCERAGTNLVRKHGQQIIDESVALCRGDRILEGIRARSRSTLARREWVERGRANYAGRRMLFVLPIAQPGGGGNVVIDEAMAMREMGVDVEIFNLAIYRAGFEAAYPDLSIPTTFGIQEDLVTLASGYDAVIATHNASVAWLASIRRQNDCPVRGYYVQGFEPYMYPPETEDFRQALASYSLFPDLVRFTKTEWTRQEVLEKTGADSTVIGVSLNTDLFRPRPRSGPEWPTRPLRVAAMVRPNSPYREPKLTMDILRRMTQRYGTRVEAVIFGTTADEPEFAELAHGFAWTLAGVLNQKQMARLMNEVDVFVDFSSHQAMGLTALEAMACGAAIIVPSRGGATSFVRDGENGLVVDTSSPDTCWQALQRLVEDSTLRLRLQQNALMDVCDLFPERPALHTLEALFAGRM